VLPLPRHRILAALFALALLVPARQGYAQGGTVVARKVHDFLNFPSTLKWSPDGRLFYLETFTGNIMVFTDTVSFYANQWGNIPVFNTVEHGLLGMAFHPLFPDSPYIYFYHTNPAPIFNRVVRMTDSSGVGTHYCVLFDSLAAGSESHEGGRLAFGPDGMLYVTVGDQGISANSQDVTTPLGKILRLTTMGKPAPGNPFGLKNPVICYGSRNSYGICFDPLNGYGYFTENGPDCDDELNFLQFGANYGWGPNDLCGSQPDGTMLPMWTVTPTIAPTGCCVYRGSFLYPYNGNIFFTSYNQGNLWRCIPVPDEPDQASDVRPLVDFYEAALDVCEGPQQDLWVSTVSGIWRVSLPVVGTDSRAAPVAAWRPGPSPFASHLMLAPRGGEHLRRVEVLDLTGRRVRSFDGPIPPTAEWDGRDESGRALPAGVYLVRAETDAGPLTRSVVRLAR